MLRCTYVEATLNQFNLMSPTLQEDSDYNDKVIYNSD